mgnify:CR=1 FL=1
MAPSSSVTTAEETLVVSLSDHIGPNSDVELILASQSPRRREILDMMGLAGKYSHTPSPLDEAALQIELKHEKPVVYTARLAEAKARALAEQIVNTVTKPTLVLGSDTIVDFEEQILEKPQDESDAKRMLTRLSGMTHQVHTGVAIYKVVKGEPSPQLVTSFTNVAQVCFAELSEKTIDAYIATGEPMDKAGSYGIQGIGGQLVSGIEGDFFTVMGLPMHRTSMALGENVLNIVNGN